MDAHLRKSIDRRRRGFSLVELLVVVALIALLLALLAPSAGALQRLARTNLCKANLHAIGQAAAQYAADNHLYVPRDAWDASQPGHYLFAACFLEYTHGVKVPPDKLQDWAYMYKALKDAAPIYRCPAIEDPKYVLTYLANAVDYEHFQTGKTYESPLPVRLTHLPASPGEICYVIEANVVGLPYNNFGTHDVRHTSHMPFVGYTPNLNARCITATDQRHEGKTTLVFFDGHCEDRPILPRQLPITLFNPLDRSRL